MGTADRRVLVVGQAVFGWIPDWGPAELESQDGFERVLRETQSACYERADPMDWIANHRVRTSPFWRTVRRLVEGRYPDSDAAWYSHVAWTNIYPVARNDVKGNPEGELRSAQTRAAAPLLEAVADAVQPDAVVVLGGGYWWDVADRIQLTHTTSVERPLLACGTRRGISWTAGWHPGGAQRRGWGATRYADLLNSLL